MHNINMYKYPGTNGYILCTRLYLDIYLHNALVRYHGLEAKKLLSTSSVKIIAKAQQIYDIQALHAPLTNSVTISTQTLTLASCIRDRFLNTLLEPAIMQTYVHFVQSLMLSIVVMYQLEKNASHRIFAHYLETEFLCFNLLTLPHNDLHCQWEDLAPREN